MVDTEGIEIAGHHAQAGLPPREAVFSHLFPVVGWEAPVLAILCEGIRWCTCLGVKVEEFRMNPRINAGAADSNRKVALEDYAVAAGIGADLRQLCIKMILDKEPEIHIVRMLRDEFVNFFL